MMQENLQSPYKKYDKVVTADEIVIGDLLRIHHRQEDINPELRLYASYLEVWSVELGVNTYIPTDFIDEYEPAAGTIHLSATMRTVQEETWDRAPAFIAGRKSHREELPAPADRSLLS